MGFDVCILISLWVKRAHSHAGHDGDERVEIEIGDGLKGLGGETISRFMDQAQ